MLLLILTVCGLATPDRCDERRLQFAEGSAIQCTTSAMPLVAQWVGEHPGLRVTSFRCAYGDAEGEGI